MARRSAVQSGAGYAPGSGADPGAPGYPQGGYPSADPWEAPEPKKRRKSGRGGSGGSGGRSGWGGSGGRWLIYIGRGILWAFIIVVLVNGIRAPFERFTAKPGAPASTDGGGGGGAPGSKPQFPAALASAFALDFAGVYLNYDQATAPDREKQLAPFLADGVDPQLGWDATGRSVLDFEHVSGVRASDTNHALVMLMVRVNGKSFQLAVPVYAKDGALVVTGRPASLPMPPKAAPPPAAQDHDSALETELNEPLTGFFKAYGSGDAANLQRYTDRPIAGLGGALTFGQIKEIGAPHGAPASRSVTATVTWRVPSVQAKVPGGTLEQTYALTMVKKDGNWYVRDIRGSTLSAGS